MTESFILEFAPQRVKQLGYNKYHLRYRDMLVEPNTPIRLSAYNELLFIVDDPSGLVVESDYGIYDSTDNPVPENVHQHRGEVIIRNPGPDGRRIKLIQIIIVN